MIDAVIFIFGCFIVSLVTMAVFLIGGMEDKQLKESQRRRDATQGGAYAG